jgi:hypothetical protein
LDNNVVSRHATPFSNVFFFLFGHLQGGAVGDCHQGTPYQIDEDGADDDSENRCSHVPQDCETSQLSAALLHGQQVLDSEDHGNNDQG